MRIFHFICRVRITEPASGNKIDLIIISENIYQNVAICCVFVSDFIHGTFNIPSVVILFARVVMGLFGFAKC